MKLGIKGKKLPLVNMLNLYLDENYLIRCRDRLQYSDLSEDTASPILLPSKSHLTKLIIEYIHDKKFHAGVGYVLSELRNEFWIPKGRQTVKSVIRKCFACKKAQGRSYAQQPHAPLPQERVKKALPFQITGLDYSGSLNVKNNFSFVKVYIALFTCAVSRAVHLEIVENCSEKEFLNAFRRFVARRSLPSMIISDNATTFEAVNRTLRSLFNDEG